MEDKLIVALDCDSLKEAKKLIDVLFPEVKIFKIGYQLFLKEGWQTISLLKKKKAKVFLDLKLFDIPNTVCQTAKILMKEDIFMFNIHALGGYKMMHEVVSVTKSRKKRPLIVAVTLLTSFDRKSLKQLGLKIDVKQEVVELALLAKRAGLDGVVASAQDVQKIKEICGKNFIVVCPGIRPQGTSCNDQKRIATPAGAIAGGADYIVVGRPIREAKDPLLVAKKIKEQIRSV